MRKTLKSVTVTVDRPINSAHPKYPDLIYPINYGYVEGIIAEDYDMQDAYILGVNQPVKTFTGKLIAIIHRMDDVETKWVVAPFDSTFTASEIIALTYFQERFFHSWIECL